MGVFLFLRNVTAATHSSYGVVGFVPRHTSLDWFGKLIYLIPSVGEKGVVDVAVDEYGNDQIISLGFLIVHLNCKR